MSSSSFLPNPLVVSAAAASAAAAVSLLRSHLSSSSYIHISERGELGRTRRAKRRAKYLFPASSSSSCPSSSSSCPSSSCSSSSSFDSRMPCWVGEWQPVLLLATHVALSLSLLVVAELAKLLLLPRQATPFFLGGGATSPNVWNERKRKLVRLQRSSRAHSRLITDGHAVVVAAWQFNVSWSSQRCQIVTRVRHRRASYASIILQERPLPLRC